MTETTEAAAPIIEPTAGEQWFARVNAVLKEFRRDLAAELNAVARDLPNDATAQLALDNLTAALKLNQSLSDFTWWKQQTEKKVQERVRAEHEAMESLIESLAQHVARLSREGVVGLDPIVANNPKALGKDPFYVPELESLCMSAANLPSSHPFAGIDPARGVFRDSNIAILVLGSQNAEVFRRSSVERLTATLRIRFADNEAEGRDSQVSIQGKR